MYRVKAKQNDKIAIFNVRKDTLDEIVVRQVWEKDFYLDNGYSINFGDTVIDIGAHIGTFAVLARSYGANITAYEPEPDNFKMLKGNLKLNNIRAKISKKAVSNTDKDDKLWIDNKNVGGHSFIKGSKKDFIDVKCISLKTILDSIKKCDLLKLDCEGSEYEILINSDLSKVSKISMEYHGKKEAKELIKYLKKQKFKIDTFYGDNKLGKIQARKYDVRL